MISKFFKDLGSHFALGAAAQATEPQPARHDRDVSSSGAPSAFAPHNNDLVAIPDVDVSDYVLSVGSDKIIHHEYGSETAVFEGNDEIYLPDLAEDQTCVIYDSSGDTFSVIVPEDNAPLVAEIEGRKIGIEPGDIIRGHGRICFEPAPDVTGQDDVAKRIGVTRKPAGNNGPTF